MVGEDVSLAGRKILCMYVIHIYVCVLRDIIYIYVKMLYVIYIYI